MKQHHFTFLILFMSLALIYFSAPVSAQSIYRWTDAQGRIHFSNAPVSEATAVDDELPPATSFGGVQGSLPSSLQTSPSTEQQSDTQPSTAALTPDQGEVADGDDSDPANNAESEEVVATDQEQATIPEESARPENEEPIAEENVVELLPQPFVDFSEGEGQEAQTVASENQLLDEDLDQPAPETKDIEEKDPAMSEDSEDTDNDQDNDKNEEEEEDS